MKLLGIYKTAILAKALILLNSCAIYAPTPCISIRVCDGVYSAAFHAGFGVWYGICGGVSRDDAFFAVGAFLDRVANVPQFYSLANEQAMLDAAREVMLAFLPAALANRTAPVRHVEEMAA